MKKSELKKIIKEEIIKVFGEIKVNKPQVVNKYEVVLAKIEKMSPEEFVALIKKVGEYDLWKEAHKPTDPFDPFNNVEDRMEAFSTFEEEDIERYYDALKN